jgi:hypothetical protein
MECVGRKSRCQEEGTTEKVSKSKENEAQVFSLSRRVQLKNLHSNTDDVEASNNNSSNNGSSSSSNDKEEKYKYWFYYSHFRKALVMFVTAYVNIVCKCRLYSKGWRHGAYSGRLKSFPFL